METEILLSDVIAIPSSDDEVSDVCVQEQRSQHWQTPCSCWRGCPCPAGGSGEGPVQSLSSWEFLALPVCCSSCVTVGEGLSRGLCLVELVHGTQGVENMEIEACL